VRFVPEQMTTIIQRRRSSSTRTRTSAAAICERRCGTRPVSRQVILSSSADRRDPPRHRAEAVTGTTSRRARGRRVTFDFHAGGAIGRTASTSEAWRSVCCCRCSSSSSGHEWIVWKLPRGPCRGLVGPVAGKAHLLRLLSIIHPLWSCGEHSSRAGRVGL
jgi:hypothetical protein